MPLVSGHNIHLPRQTSGARPNVNNGRNGHGGSGAPIWRHQSGGGGLSEPVTLAPDIWGGERRFAIDGGKLCGVDRKHATPMGTLVGPDGWATDRTGQAAIGQAGWCGKNLVLPNVEVCLTGDRVQSKGSMRNRAVRGWNGSRHGGGDK